VPNFIARRRLPSSSIPIDLSKVPKEESEEPSIACMRVRSSTMAIDLNKILGERSEEPLPDLNQEPDNDGDEIHYL
jgi:hypothetical protein